MKCLAICTVHYCDQPTAGNGRPAPPPYLRPHSPVCQHHTEPLSHQSIAVGRLRAAPQCFQSLGSMCLCHTATLHAHNACFTVRPVQIILESKTTYELQTTVACPTYELQTTVACQWPAPHSNCWLKLVSKHALPLKQTLACGNLSLFGNELCHLILRERRCEDRSHHAIIRRTNTHQ